MSHRPHRPLNHSVVIALAVLALAACGLRGAGAAGGAVAESERIAELLGIEAGSVVADVGAGDGDFSQELAARVGAGGRVYSTEVKRDLVKKIETRMKRQRLSQVRAILGDQDQIGLAEGCCDAILLRLVYHHFVRPEKMRSDLSHALRPGGLILIIDILPQEDWRELPGVPDRGGHGIPEGDLVAEMVGAGFELVEQQAQWNGDEDRFAVVFRRPGR